MGEKRNTRTGNASRLLRPCIGPFAALVLGLSVATLALAQGGPVIPPSSVPLPNIGGSPVKAETLPPITGAEADDVPPREVVPPPSGPRVETTGDDREVYDPQVLLPLLQEEARLLENFGPDHPQVQSVRERIRLVRANSVRNPVSRRNTREEADPSAVRPALRLIPEGITLVGASGRGLRGSAELPPLTPALGGTTTKTSVSPEPPAADHLTPISGESTPKNRSDPEPSGPFGLVLQWIGIAVLGSFGLAALSLLAYLFYRRLGGGLPLIQVHLVNTQTGGNESPGGYPAMNGVARQYADPTPTQALNTPEASPMTDSATPANATPDGTLEGNEDTIVKQVLAMNLQLKAEMMKSEEEGGEPTPFGPPCVDAATSQDSTENPARAEMESQ